jgi:hypothetical protein
MTIHYPDDAAIDRIGAGLRERTLPKAAWTHAGHFAAALWLLRRHPEKDAVTHMPPLIRAYNESIGTANTDHSGYHETITLASIRAARSVLAAHPPSLPLHELVDRLMATPLGRSDWLLAYWTKVLLFSVEARRGWVEPDLAPLPW